VNRIPQSLLLVIAVTIPLSLGSDAASDSVFGTQEETQESSPPKTNSQPKTAQPKTAQPTAKPEAAAENDEKVKALEERVAHLERLIFATAQLSTYEAERRLEAARTQLGQTRRLFVKGVARQAEVNLDRYLVDRAERELDLAKATDGQFRISAEIDCLRAEFELENARQRLQFSQEQLNRGFVDQSVILRQQVFIDNAAKNLNLARQRLQAIKDSELKGLTGSTKKPESETDKMNEKTGGGKLPE